MRTIRLNDGRLFLGELMKFIFKTSDPPDRLKSVIYSIKSAKEQLSGNQCGIICVNMSHISDKLIEPDYARLGNMIGEILRNNSSISAVVVSSEFCLRDAGGNRYLHKASTIRNKSAKLPLPEDFVIINQ